MTPRGAHAIRELIFEGLSIQSFAVCGALRGEAWWSSYGFAEPNSAIWFAPDGRSLMVSYVTRAGK
jgi:hypothetical protein